MVIVIRRLRGLSTPLKLVIILMFLLGLVVLMIVIFRPNMIQFSDSASDAVSNSTSDIIGIF